MNSLLNKTDDQLLKYSMKYYRIVHGRECKITSPTYFTEKLIWYTFFYRNPLCPYVVDKVTFKDYVKDKLGEGYTIPLISAWKSIEELEQDWNSLPEEFCLKSNLSSNGKNIKIIHKRTNVDFEQMKSEVTSWFKPENTCINSLARPLYNTTPMVLVEEYMSNYGDQLYDYKFFCFDGDPICMYTAIDQFEDGVNTDAYPIMFYDLNWSKMNVKYGHHPNNGDVPKPFHYADMIEIAKKISKDFPFVRVDFFDTEDKLYLAELTFNPGGGFSPYYPLEFDEYLGSLFNLPEK